MGFSTGIVGLPNVGKSTLFSAITNVKAEISNYAFTTIEPNVGIVDYYDKDLVFLADIYKPKKIVFSQCKFVDIAGLIKGASKGEGLGNKFLQNIKEVDVICHVVRCFDDNSILRTGADPITDVQVINLELIYADLEQVNNRILKVKKKAESGDKLAKFEYNLCLKLKTTLEADKFVNELIFDEQELAIIKTYNLLTFKPFFYVANINDDQIENPHDNQNYLNLKKFIEKTQPNSIIVPISCRYELELSELKENERSQFLSSPEVYESGLNKIVACSYKLLNYETFYTAGSDEVRAWLFKKGMDAQECAGLIHTDFIKNFIRAEIIKFIDFKQYQSELAVKNAGKLFIEGKKYLICNQDIVHFIINK